jgi:hypothetical protein
MPPLTLHTVMAKELADRLRHRLLDQERGNLYLGSTAPDLRVITRWERERTHFFDLGNVEEQSSVAGLFLAHPGLARAAALNESTAAFIAGYLTHLVMDEMWMTTIYRPFFVEGSSLEGDPWSNIMDRVVQFSIDREKRSDRALVAHLVDEVARCDLALEIDFIDGETLHRWREVVMEIVNQPADWSRFRYVAGRHLREAGIETPEAWQEFLASLPDLLEQALRYLTPERIHWFVEESGNRGRETVKEYLECA